MTFEWPRRDVSGRGGVRLNVFDAGEGEAVVLLHGFPDSSYMWRYQIEALVGAGYRAVAPDMRGFGDSERPTSVDDYRTEHLIDDVRLILDELDIETAAVVGHDAGAVTAWGAAATLPDRVSALAALSVGHPALFLKASRIEQPARSWYMVLFQMRGVAERFLSAGNWRFARFFLSTSPDVDRYIERFSSDPSSLTAELNWYRANATPRGAFSDRYRWPPVTCPTLGVWSSKDAALTEKQMMASQRLVEGPWTYRALEGLGHWFPIEAPEVTNELLLDFLARPLGSQGV